MTVSEPDGGGTPSREPAADDAEALPPGTKVGEYRVDGLLGEGGFGAVYRATHPLIGKTAAIKVIKREYSEDAEMVSRFVAEARAVNAIGHRNIIDIFGFGRLPDGRHYYVMELLDGVTLEAHIQALGSLAVTETLEILRPLARAIHAAHEHGIAHRDLKPENIFLANVGEPKPLVKLLDFGIAKLTGDLGAQHTTQAGMPLGTPAYMSPEQVNGTAVDARTDVYSFGIVAFEMLSGTLPFLGESALDVMVKQAGLPPPPISAMRPELAPLDGAIARMLSKDAAARPPSTLAAVDALLRAAVEGGLVEAAKESVLAPEPELASVEAQVVTEAVTQAAVPRRWPIAVAVAVALAGGVVIARMGAGSKTVAPIASASASAEPAPQPSASTAVARVAPLASSSATTDVTVALELDPADAEIHLGARRIESSPFSVPRGAEPITVEIRKKGYAVEKLTLIPDRDRAFRVKLTKQAQGAKEYGTWD